MAIPRSVAINDTRTSHQALSLVLLTYVVAMLPQALLAPSWVDVVCLSLTAWRWYCSKYSKGLPSSTLVGVVGVLGFGAVLATTGFTISARHGIYGLTILVACKIWYEDHRGQWSTTLCLVPFILLGYFLENDPSWYVGYLALFFWAWSAAFVCVWGVQVCPRESFYRSAPAVFAAAPLVALLFYGMPKPDDIWTYLQSRATTGMSRSMKPGSIGQLTNSKETAFSVAVAERIPEKDLYWRASVLQHYDGSEWTEIEQTKGAPTWKVIQSGTQTAYRVYIDSNKDDFRYALETSSEVGGQSARDSRVVVRSTGMVMPAALRKTVIDKRQSSAFVSYAGQASATNRLVTPPTADDLALPAAVHPQTDVMVGRLRAESSGNTQRYIASLHTWFVDNRFTYSTEPGAMDGDWLDTFLFDRREGFCEHYASAVTFLLRRGGIPARVVTGYQGGDYQDEAKLYTVPQAAAHAWLEYWDVRSNGWVRLDPTGWVAPGRLAVAGWRTSNGIADTHADLSDWWLLKTWGSSLVSRTGKWLQHYTTTPGEKLPGLKLAFSAIGGMTMICFGLLGSWAVQRKWHLAASTKAESACTRMVMFFASSATPRRGGQTVRSWIDELSETDPDLAGHLSRWYVQYAEQAYAGKKTLHLGLYTMRLQVRMAALLTQRKIYKHRCKNTTPNNF